MSNKDDSVRISKFGFWLITAILTVVITGFGAWISSTHTQLSETKVEMAKISSDIANIKEKIDQSLKVAQDVNSMHSEMAVLKARLELLERDINNNRGVRFNMTDYDKYVKPIQDDLLQRISRLEAQSDE